MKLKSIAASTFAAAWMTACSSSNGGGADAGSSGSSGKDASSSSGDAAGSAQSDGSTGPDGSTRTDGSTSGGDGAASSGPDAQGPDGATCAPGTNFQTDSANCGRCGKSCFGADCLDGLCDAVLVMDAPQPNTFGDGRTDAYTGFVAGSTVYVWEEAESGDHYDLLSASTTPATPASTGSPPLQSTALPPFAGAVTFDSTNIYEAFQPLTAGGSGQVMVKRLADGSAPTKMFTLPAGALDWDNIAIGSDAVYVTGTTPFTSTAIYRIATPIADPTSTPTAIITGLGEKVTDLSVFGNNAVGNHLFWLDYLSTRPDSDAGAGSDWFVYTAPTTPGATPVLLDDASTSAASFASDGTYVYWTETNDAGRLMRCPLASLDPAHVQPVADVASAQEGIVVQGSYAWVMELSDPGPVYRINTATGAKDLVGNRTVGASIKNSYLFGIDSSFIYMASIDGPVYRLPNAP